MFAQTNCPGVTTEFSHSLTPPTQYISIPVLHPNFAPNSSVFPSHHVSDNTNSKLLPTSQVVSLLSFLAPYSHHNLVFTLKSSKNQPLKKFYQIMWLSSIKQTGASRYINTYNPHYVYGLQGHKPCDLVGSCFPSAPLSLPLCNSLAFFLYSNMPSQLFCSCSPRSGGLFPQLVLIIRSLLKSRLYNKTFPDHPAIVASKVLILNNATS